MKKYFDLYNNCKFVKFEEKGCLYDTISGKLYNLSADYAMIIKNALLNVQYDINNPILKEIVDLNLGQFVDFPVIHENNIVDYKDTFVTFNAFNKLDEIFIQITNECNNNCNICDKTNIIFSKTHCKLWPERENKINVGDWEKIFQSANNLSTQRINFIGGNPFLNIGELENIIKVARCNNINKFVVYANVNYLNEKIICLCKKYDIKIVVQLMNFSKELYLNISKLIDENIDLEIAVLQGIDYGIEFHEMILLLKRLGTRIIHLSKLYGENFAVDEFDEKIQGFVSEKKITMYGLLNSCLYGKIFIAMDGKVMPCPMMQNEVIGSVLEEDLWEILKNKKYQELITSSRDRIKGCENCVFRFNCNDCRAIEYQQSGELFMGANCREVTF